MQSSQESSPPSSRPSLLSTDQQAQVDSQRLLAGVDAKRANPVKPKRRSPAWLAGLLVLVAGGGAAAWMTNQPEEVVAAVPQTRVSGPVAPPAPPAPVVEAPEVSTAAILQDTPAADDKPAAPKGNTDALTALLESKPAARSVPKPVRVHEEARNKAHKLAARERTKHATEKHPLARDVLAKKAPAPEADSDVALLAALVAHSKAVERAAPAPSARKLKACKARPSVAEAEACRARLCEGAAKNSAACRPASPARVVDAS